jgi:uncharacterized protein YdeI (YjbR/CyaY-like superfamily)
MRPAGIKAFKSPAEDRTGIYAYEQRRSASLGDELEQQFDANKRAWEFFQAQPAGYKRTAILWVVSAKRQETRRKRLATLIEDSQHGRRLRSLTRPARAD